MIPLSLCCVLFTMVAAAQTNNSLRARLKVKDTTVAPEMSAGTLPEGRKALSLFTPSHLVGARLRSQPGYSEVTTRIIYLLLVTLSIKIWVHPVSGLWKLYAKKVKSHLRTDGSFPSFLPDYVSSSTFLCIYLNCSCKKHKNSAYLIKFYQSFHINLTWQTWNCCYADLLFCFFQPATVRSGTKQNKTKKTPKTQKKYFPDRKGVNVCGCLWFVMQRTRRHSLQIQQPPHKTGRQGLLPAPPHVQTQLGFIESWKQIFTDNNSVHRTASLINKGQNTKKQSS